MWDWFWAYLTFRSASRLITGEYGSEHASAGSTTRAAPAGERKAGSAAVPRAIAQP
jgi:hypothetical protein